MTTIRSAVRRVEEGIANMGDNDNQAPLQDNKVPPLEQVPMGGRVLVLPSPITDCEIRSSILNFSQAMTSKSNSFTCQVQDVTVQVNREVGPHMPPHANTMAYHLIDFTRKNPPMFFGSKFDEDPQYFLDESYRILFLLVWH
ncbi:hypothetical protein EJD97_014606 [Solanum chilense]|uniref:Uncharacterized protein n=1 Tax=Solanum chilense TaxID=4083 RepID=A0A6N2B8R5_SOLCI|nr:hypothetical protein EJD97_014606 [Solanum chilense]